MSLSKSLSRTLAKFTLTLTEQRCSFVTQPTLSVKCSVRALEVKRPLWCLTDRSMSSLCPRDLCRYCQSDLELSDTFSPRANTDSQPHNLSTHPSTRRPCHTARNPPKHLLRRFFFFWFFLIGRIFPVSNNSPSPPSLHFRPARMPHHILQTWADRRAGRLEEVRRRRVGKVAAGCTWREERDAFLLWGGSMLSARDVGRCSAECEDRGQQDWDHNNSITTGPL